MLLIREDNRISQRAMAAKLGIGFDTVKEYVRKLKSAGRLTRHGADNGGYWQVHDIQSASMQSDVRKLD